MRYLVLLLILLPIQIAFADTIVIEKETGKLLEYQSNGKSEVMINNVLGYEYPEGKKYKREDIEAKIITPEQWKQIKYEQIELPAKAEQEAKEIEKQAKADIIKKKLKLSDEEWEDFKKALK